MKAYCQYCGKEVLVDNLTIGGRICYDCTGYPEEDASNYCGDCGVMYEGENHICKRENLE